MVVGEVTGTPPSLPWKAALALSWQSLSQRRGKSLLMLVCLTIAVAFLMSTLTYDYLLRGLTDSTDVHTQALLERAGIVTGDTDGMATQIARRNWILAITGLICLAGISNTMLIAVTERFREIGTMKCLGAPDRLVVRLFFTETLILAAASGIFGITTGYLLSVVQLAMVLEVDLHGFRTFLTAFFRCAPPAFFFGMVLAILAALYPAWVASRMRPAEAMRREI